MTTTQIAERKTGKRTLSSLALKRRNRRLPVAVEQVNWGEDMTGQQPTRVEQKN